MDNKEYSGYQVADITESDNSMINRLEEEISQKTDKDIVLVAYQQDKQN
ncbi:hypothetical protein NE689_05470 [Lactonifactor longoviformis]|nr:hypothetical protein [Lactonifactor longoviformis]MCQ4670762.1 hypothetical protein [Lactonifactor longoviformis]